MAAAVEVGRARLHLDLAHAEGEIRATISRAGDGTGPLRTSARRAFDAVRVRSLRDEMTALLERSVRYGGPCGDGLDLLSRHGQLLFDEVLPGPVKDALRAAGPAHLSVCLDESLVFVPWEWMHDGGGFLALRGAMGRVVRSEARVLGAARGAPVGPPSMLVLCDPRGDLVGSYYEGQTLRDRLEGAGARIRIDLRSTEVEVTEVKRLLRDYDLVHYAGHAEIRPEHEGPSGWLLRDGVWTAREILDLAGGRPFPRLVFANACRSGPEVRRDPGGGTGLEGVAGAFLRAGVGHYVGTLWDVPDEAASRFALSFYDAVLAGASAGEALCVARTSLASEGGAGSVVWAAWVLYGDPFAPVLAARPRPSNARRAPRRIAAGIPRPVSPAVEGPVREQPTRGGSAVLARRPLSADPPFEMAGAAQRRFLAALAMTTAVTLAVLLTILAGRSPSHAEAELAPGRSVPQAARPEVYPLPRSSGASPIATAPAGPATAALQVLLQGPSGEEAPRPEAAVLHSWDSFRLRVSPPGGGYGTVFHVESQGRIRRILPEGGPEGGPEGRPDGAPEVATVPLEAGTSITLPGGDRWFYLDDRRGTELFVLGVSREAPPADPSFDRALEQLESDLVLARARRPERGDGLLFRGLGGLRDEDVDDRAPDEATLVRRVLSAFEARFEEVHVLPVRHR